MNKPTDSVRVVIFDTADTAKFLVLAEADDPTNWKLPGGKFDSADETPQAAAERELGEELGLDGTSIALQFVGRLTNDDGVSARHIFSGQAYVAQPTPSAEIAAVQWVTEAVTPETPNRSHILSAVELSRKAPGEAE